MWGAWVEELPSVLWSFRTTPYMATIETLFNMVYGVEVVLQMEVGIEIVQVQGYTQLTMKTLEGRNWA